MDTVVKQLVQVRRIGRWLLIARRLCQATAVLIGLAILLGLTDYVFRLPGWLRGGVSLLVLVCASTWLITRLHRAVMFRPSIDDLALRAERLFPQLGGRLASAVAFASHPKQYQNPEHTAALAQASVASAQHAMSGIDLSKLISYTAAARAASVLLVVAVLLGAIVLALPTASALAAERWLSPWTGAAWPKRTEVVSATDAAIWSADMPLRLRAKVTRGQYAGMRVWLRYRLLEAGQQTGPWQQVLMSEQAAAAQVTGDQPAMFERLIDLPELRGQADLHRQVEYQFSAGDDQTPVHSIALNVRPNVQAVVANITPPAYAAGLSSQQRIDLHAQAGQITATSALVGSQVRLDITFNKPVPTSALTPANIVQGFSDAAQIARVTSDGQADDAAKQRSASFTFTLKKTVQSTIRLTDAAGMSNLSERLYRIEAAEDNPPAATMVQPAVDEAVLATAVLPIEALAQDDIAIEDLRIEANLPVRASESQSTMTDITLARQAGRSPTLTARHELNLAELALQPGDVVTLTALARDVYELAGQRHEPVRSSPRKLRIIDAATLVGQLRGELAGVRQQALRLDDTQRQILDQQPTQAQPQQQRIAQRLNAQASLVEKLQQRAQRNRLDEPAMAELMKQVASLIEAGSEASDAAQAHLADAINGPANAPAHQRQASEQQQQVRKSLAELVSLLDQGKDALTLQLQLRQLQAQQEAIAQATRELLPRTIGRDPDQLPQALREALEQLTAQQQAAAEQADALVKQMQSTAQSLSQDQSDRAQAAAESLAEAAAIAQRQGLSQRMDASSQSIDQNQLAQAGQQQTDSLEMIQQMLSEMGKQQKRMQAMLRRRLQQLVQAIEELLRRQTQQHEALAEAAQLPPLEQPQQALRRTTMATSEQARQAQQTQPVAAILDEAVSDQADAVIALRASDKPVARTAQQQAITQLQNALELVREQRDQAQQEAAKDERQQLKEAYEKLARQQQDLRSQVQEIADQVPLNRRQRAQVVGLGHAQADIRIAARELAEQVSGAELFQFVHRQIDIAADRAAGALRTAAVDEQVDRDQAAVGRLLLTMARALDEDQQDAEFAGQQGSGGGGGGGGQPPALVPPVAELKALRSLQQAIYEQTRAISDQQPTRMKRQLIELSGRQRELAGLGERLIQKLKQNAQPGEPAQRQEQQ